MLGIAWSRRRSPTLWPPCAFQSSTCSDRSRAKSRAKVDYSQRLQETGERRLFASMRVEGSIYRPSGFAKGGLPMPIPKYEQIMLPLLKGVAAVEGDTNVPALLPYLAKEFNLTEDEIQRRLPSGAQGYFANRCHWAKFYLTRAGLLEGSRRGYFRITNDGCALLRDNQQSLANAPL